MKVSTVAFSACLVALVCLVLVQTGILLRKSTDGKTTIARTTLPARPLLLPAVTLCPGFKQERVEETAWLAESFKLDGWDPDLTMSPDRAAAENDWAGANFDLGEVLGSVMTMTLVGSVDGGKEDSKDGQVDMLPFWFPEAGLTDPDPDSWVLSADTLSGRCHTLRFGRPVSGQESAHLLLDLSTTHQNKTLAYFHSPGAEFGANENLWPAPVSTVVLEAGRVVDVGLTKHVQIPSDGQQGYTEEDLFRCVRREAAEEMKELAEQGDGLCYSPAFGSLVDLMGEDAAALLKACGNLGEYKASTELLLQVLIRHGLGSGGGGGGGAGGRCGRPENVTSFEAKARPYVKVLPGGQAAANIFYDSNAVVVEEEYVLFDFADFVSSAGGVFGVFLGWSFLDLARLLSRAVDAVGEQKRFLPPFLYKP